MPEEVDLRVSAIFGITGFHFQSELHLRALSDLSMEGFLTWKVGT